MINKPIIRFLKNQYKYDYEYFIRIFALRRSGQHAIINWIANLFQRTVSFDNDVNMNINYFICNKKNILKY